MATNLNFDNLVIDRSGRASFSGLSSGIDLQKAVDGLIAARRIRATHEEDCELLSAVAGDRSSAQVASPKC